MSEETDKVKQNLNDLAESVESMFERSSGDEDMLKTATKYALQFSTSQIYILTLIKFLSRKASPETATRLNGFYNDYFELNQYNNSGLFVAKLFEFLSLRKFLGTGIAVDIKK